jgi:hypothetical protein
VLLEVLDELVLPAVPVELVEAAMVLPVVAVVVGIVAVDGVPAVDVPVPAGFFATNCSSAESKAE